MGSPIRSTEPISRRSDDNSAGSIWVKWARLLGVRRPEPGVPSRRWWCYRADPRRRGTHRLGIPMRSWSGLRLFSISSSPANRTSMRPIATVWCMSSKQAQLDPRRGRHRRADRRRRLRGVPSRQALRRRRRRRRARLGRGGRPGGHHDHRPHHVGARRRARVHRRPCHHGTARAGGSVVVAGGSWSSIGRYTTTGDVAAVRDGDTTTLVFQDLATDNGPNLFVYLSPPPAERPPACPPRLSTSGASRATSAPRPTSCPLTSQPVAVRVGWSILVRPLLLLGVRRRTVDPRLIRTTPIPTWARPCGLDPDRVELH